MLLGNRSTAAPQHFLTSNSQLFFSILPFFHYSNTPLLHHSITPILQYSNIPFFHNLEPVRGKDRIPGKCFVHEKGRILKLLVSGAKKMPYGAIENFYLLLSNQVKWR